MYRKNTSHRIHIPMVTAAALCLSALTNTAALADETIGFAKCESDYVNVRSGASTETEVVGKLYENGKVDILETSADGAWYHIRSGNVEGYVSAELIATGEEAKQIEASAGYTTAEVGAEVLNVRASMDPDSEIVELSMRIMNTKWWMIRETGSK